ncbi:TetR/AcrR family transcriptional regulator [Dactylosporangium sp. CA-233914]|uniref:TetR/AcrR family transcriptional regulator n=1 Tax=Dactylosporangium sp. CA-233914 TaxID=3239934 RepID=UPI003D93C593
MSSTAGPRRRLSRQARHAQLLDVAREVIRDEGTDALTLGHVAERAQVAKPVVYDHFRDRSGLLSALYREFDARQHAMLDASLENADDELEEVARIVAATYIECSRAEGRELADVIAALTGSPALERLRRDTVDAYIDKCQKALTPYAHADTLGVVNFRAIVAAAEALARAVIAGETPLDDAVSTLTRIITAVVTDDRAGAG